MDAFDIYNALLDARRNEVRAYEAWERVKHDTTATNGEYWDTETAYTEAKQARIKLNDDLRHLPDFWTAYDAAAAFA
jgi:hypothetical protein